jgi:hypothetical protein
MPLVREYLWEARHPRNREKWSVCAEPYGGLHIYHFPYTKNTDFMDKATVEGGRADVREQGLSWAIAHSSGLAVAVML